MGITNQTMNTGAAVSVVGGQGVTVVVDGIEYTINMREERAILVDADTVIVDGTDDNHFILTMEYARGDRDITFTNISPGQRFTILLINAGPNTVTWPTVVWPSGVGPVLTGTEDAADLIGFEKLSDGQYLGFILGQNYAL